MSDDDSESAPIRALVLQGKKLGLAKDLESARPGELVHVDQKGRIRSPARYRAIMAGSYSLLGALNIGAAWLYTIWFGPAVGLIAGAWVFGWTGLLLHRRLRVRRGLELLMGNQPEAARVIFERELNRRFTPRHQRVVLRLNLASCYVRKGQLEPALEAIRTGKKEAGKRRGLALWRHLLCFSEIMVLCGMNRAAEARAALDALPPLPAHADYLVIGQWKAELAVAFVEGKASFSDDELHERTRRALAITESALLLTLLAWAYEAIGDRERARELAVEATERTITDEHFAFMPPLKAWLDKTAAEARSAASAVFD